MGFRKKVGSGIEIFRDQGAKRYSRKFVQNSLKKPFLLQCKEI